MSATAFQVIAKPHPFQKALPPMSFDAGVSILDIVGACASRSLRVELDGREVPRHAWGAVKPKAGHVLHATMFPQGGGDGRKWIRIVALVVISILSYGAASGAAWAGTAGWSAGAQIAAGAAISIVGSLAVTPLIPAPEVNA